MPASILQHDTPPPTNEAGSQLALKIETSFAVLDTLRGAWDAAVLELDGAVYMTYDWVRIWWEFYGTDKELRIFIFRKGDKIVGIIPIYIDSCGFGPLRFRIARLVGANLPPKVFNPPIDGVWAETIWETVLRQLFTSDRCDTFSFGPASELHESTSALGKVCAKRNDLAGKCEVIEGVHSVFWLPATMEDYYESLSSKERKKRKYELKLLQKEFETKIEVITNPNEVIEEFEYFANQHASQWRAEGKTGHFGAWPKGLEFNRALVQAHGQLGRLRFIRIVANGEVVANQYVFAFGQVYYWELPARVAKKQWNRYSLGPNGAITMIDVAIQEGKTRLEGGLAHYDYKIRLGAKEYEVRTLRITAPGWRAWWRMRLFGWLRAGVGLLYHKIWYRRIMPRLPARCWHPQWNFWLRLDF